MSNGASDFAPSRSGRRTAGGGGRRLAAAAALAIELTTTSAALAARVPSSTVIIDLHALSRDDTSTILAAGPGITRLDDRTALLEVTGEAAAVPDFLGRRLAFYVVRYDAQGRPQRLIVYAVQRQASDPDADAGARPEPPPPSAMGAALGTPRLAIATAGDPAAPASIADRLPDGLYLAQPRPEGDDLSPESDELLLASGIDPSGVDDVDKAEVLRAAGVPEDAIPIDAYLVRLEPPADPPPDARSAPDEE